MQERIGIVKSNHWKQNQLAEHMEAVLTRDFFFFYFVMDICGDIPQWPPQHETAKNKPHYLNVQIVRARRVA